MAAAKIYSGPRGRGHSTCVYVKTNTQRAFDSIKKLNPDLIEAGTTEMLDFLTQAYMDAHYAEVESLEQDSKADDKRPASSGTTRKRRLGLPSQ